MRRRVVILTEIIAPYRIPVFNALAARGEVDLHVIFLAETDTTLRQWHVYRDEIQFSYEVLKSQRWRLGKINVLLNDGVRTALEDSNPEALVAGGYNYIAMWQAQAWARRKQIPFLLWSESNLRDSRSNFWLLELAKKRFVTKCQAYVVPGSSGADYMETFGPREQVFIAPNSIDVQKFASLMQEARRNQDERKRLRLPERYFLFVGRLVWDKGVFDLLAAYAMLPENVRQAIGLVFVGDGEVREELIRKSRNISVGQVVFPGFFQRDELAGFYAWADALVFPTHSDTWGFVVNEAIACGLPVIATDVAGCTADLVHDEVNGFVVPVSNPQLLSDKMLKLFHAPELCERMGRESLTRTRSYTPEIWAEGIVRAVTNCPEMKQ